MFFNVNKLISNKLHNIQNNIKITTGTFSLECGVELVVPAGTGTNR